MNRITLAALACTSSLLALTACNDDNNHSPPGTGEVRVVNGIPDSGSLSASPTSGNAFNTAGDAFDAATGAVDVPEGSYNVQLFNSNTMFTTINNVQVDHNAVTVLWARGSIDGGTGSGIAVEESLGSSPSGKFSFEFVNDTTVAGAATLSVFLVPPGTTDLTGITAAATGVEAGKATTLTSIPSGNYEIIVTSGATPIFDSGSAGMALPPAGSNMVQLGALDANAAQVTSNTAPVTLMLLDNGNNDGDSKLLLNTVAASS